MKYRIVHIEQLLPLERVFPTHLKNLERMINESGYMMRALIVDENDGIILDGSHRYVYLLKNGFKTAPVHLVDYADENVRVGSKLLHRFLIEGEVGISKQLCRDRALTGNLFPPRTTRHFFTFRKEDITLPLKQLVKGDRVDVSKFIHDVTVQEEVDHNRKFIEEINEEFEIIWQYLEEARDTREYLEDQVSKMLS